MLEPDLSVNIVAAEPVWIAERDAPQLFAHVPADLVDHARSLASGVPGLRSVVPAAEGVLVRPPVHRRACYLRAPSGHVLAVKGTEPLAFDFSSFLDELAGSRVAVELRLGNALVDRTLTRAQLTGLDKFPLLEGKVPGCVTIGEARADAEAAARVQLAYIARHGRPARLPLPVFVGRWSDDVASAALVALRARVHGRAWELLEGAARHGIGVYAYVYPTLPVRLVELQAQDVTRKRELRIRREQLAPLAPARMFDAWLELAAQLLALGFVAKDPASVTSGDCLQVQNLVIDGGFADAASLVPTKALSDRELRDAVRRTVHELAIAGTRLLVGLWSSTVEFRDRVPDLFAVVWQSFARLVAAMDVTDRRVTALFDLPASTFDALDRILRDSL